MESGAERIVRSLVDVGPATATVLADRLGVTPGAVRRHLEDIAMRLGDVCRRRCLLGLLAGQPAAPRGVSTAAVGAGPRKGQELSDDLTGLEIVNQGRRAARQRPTILVGVIALRRVQQRDTLLMEPTGTEVAVQAA